MRIQSFFPTAFCTIENPILAHTLYPQVKEILDSTEKTNFMDYHSTFDPTRPIEERFELSKEIEQFKTWAHNLGLEFLQQIGYQIDLIPTKIKIEFNRMNIGDRHKKHVHAGSLLTGTFYLHVPKGSSPLVVHDPRLNREMVPYPSLPTQFTSYKEVIDVKAGTLCLMEGYVPHEVDVNNTEGRTLIMFNIVNAN
jgi:uncharacterized protein (TIGR02466 family)